jgi:hypothetical protein
MSRPSTNPFDAFCQQAFDFLKDCEVRHLVIGGLAVGVIGEARTTGDVDVIGFMSPERAEALIAKAAEAGFDVQPEIEAERVRETGTLRFRRGLFQLDIILASLQFEETAYARALQKRIFGRMVALPTPEDLILFKVLSGRDKDILDAIGVARRHFAKLDRKYLRDTMQGICDLAEDMGPWQRLEGVLKKAAGG